MNSGTERDPRLLTDRDGLPLPPIHRTLPTDWRVLHAHIDAQAELLRECLDEMELYDLGDWTELMDKLKAALGD